MAEMMDSEPDSAELRPGHLVRGFPGHPLHPPLTDATIGTYTLATILGVLGIFGASEANMAKGWWLALIVGLVLTAPTALTGLVDWLSLTSGTPLWRTATSHMLAMLTATLFFALETIWGNLPSWRCYPIICFMDPTRRRQCWRPIELPDWPLCC